MSGSIIHDKEETTKLSKIPGEIAFSMRDLAAMTSEQVYLEMEKEFIDRMEAILFYHGIDFEQVERIVKIFRSSD